MTISRKSTNYLAQAYLGLYYERESYYKKVDYRYESKTRFKLSLRRLEVFLYDREYDTWLLQKVRTLNEYDTGALLDLIRGFHTGESIITSLPERDWAVAREYGQTVIKKLAEDVITHFQSDVRRNFEDTTCDAVDGLIRQLELDGYVYSSGKLYKSTQEPVDYEEEQNLVIRLASDIPLDNLPILVNHVSQSEKDYLEAHWGNSIINSRQFLESILREISAKYNVNKHGAVLDSKTYNSPAEVRRYMEKEGLLVRKETEAIQHTYGLLSDTGGHPNLSIQEQARLMRNLALAMSQYVLLRVGKSL
jgi:hypothetical protein